MAKHLEREALARDAASTLSQYIQFETTDRAGNDLAAAKWLADQLRNRQIAHDVTVCEPLAGRGLVMARIPGTEPLKPLVLNHHIDVVGADPAGWSHRPFGGVISDGFVWGRGALDSKGLGVMFMLALEQMIRDGVTFRRPVIYLAVPDEETGGRYGTAWLIEHHDIDPEWVWDEGDGWPNDLGRGNTVYAVNVAEKRCQHVVVTARGIPGHASMPHDDNAIVTLLRALDRVLSNPRPLRSNEVTTAMFRSIAQSQPFPASVLMRKLDNPWALRLAAHRLEAEPFWAAMLRDTVALTVVRASDVVNVISEYAEAEVDCRLLPDTDLDEFTGWMNRLISDERVEVTVKYRSDPVGITNLEGPFIDAVKHAVELHHPGAVVVPKMFAASSDSRYWRELGCPAYGFAPLVLEKADLGLSHGIDERISIDNLVRGVEIARSITERLCV